MKKVYFNCPRKGRVLALVFDKAEDITTENTKKYMECDSDRYIKIILQKGESMTCQTAIKFELDNEHIIKTRRKFLENDMEDILKIKEGLNDY